MRKKHGHYDEERHLPDNTGQPGGSGSRIWLIETVAQYWPDLAATAHQQPGDRYRYLIAQLRTMQNDEQASSVVEEYRSRINADQRERAQRDRKRRLAKYEEMLHTYSVEQTSYVAKRIATLQKNIAKAEAQERS